MKKTRISTMVALAGSVMMASTTVSEAAVSVTKVSGVNEWDINFDPITFTVISTDQLAWLVFEDFFSVDSSDRGLWLSGTLDITVGGSTTSYTPVAANGTFDTTLRVVDQNDLLINIASSGPTLTIGDEITVSTLGVRFNDTVDVPAPVAGPVNVAFFDNNGDPSPVATNTVSIAVVPEPSSIALLGCFGLALFVRRTR